MRFVPFGDVSSAFLQTSASDEHRDLTIKVPPEVVYLFPDSAGKPARYVRLVKSFYGLAAALRAWWLDITKNLSELVGNRCRLINACGVVTLTMAS